MHDCGLPRGELQRTERHIPVEEASLINQTKDLRPTHALVRPIWGPVVKDELSNVTSGVVGVEQILLRLSRYEDKLQIDFFRRYMFSTHNDALQKSLFTFKFELLNVALESMAFTVSSQSHITSAKNANANETTVLVHEIGVGLFAVRMWFGSASASRTETMVAFGRETKSGHRRWSRGGSR